MRIDERRNADIFKRKVDRYSNKEIQRKWIDANLVVIKCALQILPNIACKEEDN